MTCRSLVLSSISICLICAVVLLLPSANGADKRYTLSSGDSNGDGEGLQSSCTQLSQHDLVSVMYLSPRDGINDLDKMLALFS